MANRQFIKFRWFPHRLTVLWLFGVILLLSGCTSLPTAPNTDYQALLGQVAVIARPQVPEIRFEGFAHSKTAGVATGAGSAFLACINALADSNCSGEICGAVAILMLGACGVTSAVGGVVGALAAPAIDEVQSAEDSLSTVLDVRTIQESLRD